MKMMALILALSVAAPLALTGCERTVEETTKTKTTDSGTTVQKKTVTETPAGDVKVTEEKKTVDTSK